MAIEKINENVQFIKIVQKEKNLVQVESFMQNFLQVTFNKNKYKFKNVQNMYCGIGIGHITEHGS